MTKSTARTWHMIGTLGLLLLAGCGQGGFGTMFQNRNDAPVSAQTREVESPDIFSVQETGLWDGRPSLGGVWIAHPDVKDPQRVIIRNTENGKFVVGALFRREREIPGPRFQVSFDAALSLGMKAAEPAALSVVALRREEITDTPETQDDAAPSDPPAAQPAPVSALDKPYLQVGIFSIEANASRTARLMRSAGMVPTIRQSEIGGKPFWRVVVGPASTADEREALLSKIKNEGFTDAFPVQN